MTTINKPWRKFHSFQDSLIPPFFTHSLLILITLLCFPSAGIVSVYATLCLFAIICTLSKKLPYLGIPPSYLTYKLPPTNCIIHYNFPRAPGRRPCSWQTSHKLSVHRTESSHITPCPSGPLSSGWGFPSRSF